MNPLTINSPKILSAKTQEVVISVALRVSGSSSEIWGDDPRPSPTSILTNTLENGLENLNIFKASVLEGTHIQIVHLAIFGYL